MQPRIKEAAAFGFWSDCTAATGKGMGRRREEKEKLQYKGSRTTTN